MSILPLETKPDGTSALLEALSAHREQLAALKDHGEAVGKP